MKRNIITTVLLGYGLAHIAAPVMAQTQVNGTGATLFVDFFKDQRHTNEVVDWDMDGTVGIDIDNNGILDDRDDMAPNSPNPGFIGSAFMLFQYRSVGSIEGFSEWVDYQLLGDLPESVPSERGILNRLEWANTGVIVWGGIPGSCVADTDGDGIPNASGTPLCPTSMDFACTDVPTLLGIVGSGSGIPYNWSAAPGSTGYGKNSAVSCGDSALSQTGQSNLLASLTRGAFSLNLNTGSPDANTIYETQITYSPICIIANRGTGFDVDTNGVEDGTVKYSTAQYLFLTGRMPSGENLNVATRDVGSGTRNGMMNSLGVDPSFGVGDHIGRRIDQAVPSPQTNPPKAWTNLGPAHQVNNCGGSGVMENAVRNDRLAVGYTGVVGASRAAQDANGGQYEILSIVKDVDTDGDGTVGDYTNPAHRVRPTLTATLHNLDERTGWQYGGIQTFETRGSPDGTDIDSDGDGTVDFPAPNPALPDVSNQFAAMYFRNLTLSIANFDANPPAATNARTPADFMARNFYLLAAVDALPASNALPTRYVANAGLLAGVQSFSAANHFLVTNPVPTYGSKNAAGQVPTRIASPDFNFDGTIDAYTDGSTNGQYRYRNGGSLVTIAGGSNRLAQRNRCQGDFNRDGKRDINDVEKMVEAYQHRDPSVGTYFEGGTDWGGDKGSQAGDNVIVDVIGDFNGDGNFDKEDVRFFCDGLAIDSVTHKLNRREAFRRVDAKWFALTGSHNFFGTVWADGRAFSEGDSAYDMAGGSFVCKGAAPTGSDGTIDAADNAYIRAQIAAGDVNGDCRANWSDVIEAVRFDLSADTNGDLFVDVDDLWLPLTGCVPCDTNCNGTVNPFDIQPFIELLSGTGCPCSPCAGDANGNGTSNPFDINAFLVCLGA